MKRKQITNAQKKEICEKQRNKCRRCDQLLNGLYDIDHIQPLWDGGTNVWNNLQALCVLCHAEKTRIDEPYIRNLQKEWHPTFRFCWKCKNVYSCFFYHCCIDYL